MAMVRLARRSPLVTVIVVALLALAAVFVQQQAFAASNLPADKMTVTASRTAVTGPNTEAVILTAQMKTSTPADLLLQLTAECSILSEITNTGSETQAYSTKVELWIDIDGKTVPVVPAPTLTGASGSGSSSDNGRVVFCNREFKRTTVYDSNNESIKDIENTSEANAFNWVALNVGNGIHTIKVHVKFTDTNTMDAMSHGVISDRSLNAEATNYYISQPSP